jgi:hypothetical protein
MVEHEYKFLVSCRESDITKERIERVLKAGANVVLTTKGIDDMSLKASSYKQHYEDLFKIHQSTSDIC